jgi:hypothetical protein
VGVGARGGAGVGDELVYDIEVKSAVAVEVGIDVEVENVADVVPWVWVGVGISVDKTRGSKSSLACAPGSTDT